MIQCNDNHSCHIDVTDVTLVADDDDRQFGIGIDSADYSSEGFIRPPFVSYLEPGGVAERSGLLQEGDRVLAINGWSLRGRTMQDVAAMIHVLRGHLILRIEFDVADSVVSSSGIYLVKMAKRGNGIGISISCPKNRMQGQPLVISDVKKGSIAHRTGTISPGDYLLAVGDIWLENYSLEEAARILTNTDRIVKLRIQKNECYADEPDPKSVITYNVELPRYAGRLGIALSSQSEPPGMVVIASLSPDGLAEKTGALRVGDRVLAINGVVLRGKNVEDAIHLLPTTDDAINIKIMRNLSNPGSRKDSTTSAVSRPSRLISLDTALKSWDGWGHDYSLPRSQTQQGDHKTNGQSRNSDSQSGSAEVFCDLDQGHGGRQHQPTWASKSSPRSSSPTNARQPVCDDAAITAAATAVAFEFRSPDTGEAPSSIYAVDGNRMETATPLCDPGVATSTAIIDDEPDVSVAPTTAAETDWSVPVATGRPSVSPLEELIVTSLQRLGESDSFGFSLSNGVYESGIYVGAVKDDGPAAEKLQPYDRILKVNGLTVTDLTCTDVVPLIAQSGCRLDLVIGRRPLNSGTDNHHLALTESRSSGGSSSSTRPLTCSNKVVVAPAAVDTVAKSKSCGSGRPLHCELLALTADMKEDSV
jgi:C-terminal processing protease CtpA/Prc